MDILKKMTKAELIGLIENMIDRPMGLVVERLAERSESSLTIAQHVDTSASTIRSLRSGAHSGNLRVDVWAELLRWTFDQPES